MNGRSRSEEHTSELQSLAYLVCRLLLEKKQDHGSLRAARAYSRPTGRRFLSPQVAATNIYTLSLHDALPISMRATASHTDAPPSSFTASALPSWIKRPAEVSACSTETR